MNDTDNWTIIGMMDGFDEKIISQVTNMLKEHKIPCTAYGSVYYCVKVTPSDAQRARGLLLSSASKWDKLFRVVDEYGQPVAKAIVDTQRKEDFWGTKKPSK